MSTTDFEDQRERKLDEAEESNLHCNFMTGTERCDWQELGEPGLRKVSSCDSRLQPFAMNHIHTGSAARSKQSAINAAIGGDPSTTQKCVHTRANSAPY